MAKHSRHARARDSFVRVVEDPWLQYRFLSYEQIESGELTRGGFKVLLLPQSVAMSAPECRRIAAFVRAGGTVIADCMTATMDEHCRRLKRGQLDDLFGIRRASLAWRPRPEAGKWTTVAGAAPLLVYERDIAVTTGKATYTTPRAPAVIVREVGRGRALYLNLDVRDYGRLRLTPPKGDAYRELFRGLLGESGVEAPVRVLGADGRPVACAEVWRYRGEGAEYVALLRNPAFEAHSLGAVGYTGNAALGKTERVQVLPGRPARVTDVRTGTALNVTDRVDVELDAWSLGILERRAAPGPHGSNSAAPTRRAASRSTLSRVASGIPSRIASSRYAAS